MAQREFQCVVRTVLILVLLVAGRTTNGQTLTLQSTASVVLENSSINLTCATTNSQDIGGTRWFKDGTELSVTARYMIYHDSGRATSVLVITNATVVDSGVFACQVGDEMANSTLVVLPESWQPVCSRSDGSGRLGAGDSFTVTCASAGHANTSLAWYQSNGAGTAPLLSVSIHRSGYDVALSYTGTVGEEDVDGSLLFLCDARLGKLSRSCHITVNDDGPISLVPFIVVGLMSLIALLLFFLVLFILFRHRQCRFCREPIPEPQHVLDAEAVQSGSWVPPPVVAIEAVVIEDEGEESRKDGPGSGYTNPDFQSQPPDVVPLREPRTAAPDAKQSTDPQPAGASTDQPGVSSAGPGVPATSSSSDSAQPKSKIKNRTLTKNMDQNFDKPIQTLEKNTLPNRKGRHTKGERKRVKHYNEPPVKARIKIPKDPIYAQVKKLNIPRSESSEGPSTSSSGGADSAAAPAPSVPRVSVAPPPVNGDSKETSSTTTDSTDQSSLQLVNDLGGGEGSKKKQRVRHYRKKSEGSRRSLELEEGGMNLNIKAEPSVDPAPSTSSSRSSGKKKKDKIPADRVIYAQLDFTKKVGLNITE